MTPTSQIPEEAPTNHRPDILSCLANLSSDEVFTPPKTANAMLDLLPPEVWSNPDLKWLNPACKSGALLREVATRLMAGLAEWEPDANKRREHILKNMLYGIAITEICALMTRRTLYCSARANSPKSNCKFSDEEGNIFFPETKHTFKNGACLECGAPEKEEYVNDVLQEIHAYAFIHNNLPERIKTMKFDIIITNPPYQLKTGGHGAQARPIYQLFVQKARTMARHTVIIMPARWFAGGMGLDTFRKEMMADKSLKTMVDIHDSEEAFPGVSIAGGVCYFHRDSQYQGPCNFNGVKRDLGEFDVIIRDHRAISILKKVLAKSERFFSETVTPLDPFGLPTNFDRFSKKETPETLGCLTKDGMRLVHKEEIRKGHDLINKWKSICSRADGAAAQEDSLGRRKGLSISRILPPHNVCLWTYLVTGTYPNKFTAEKAASYLLLKLPRYLLGLRKLDQNISSDKFQWVPIMDWSQEWTDEKLYKHFGLTKEEIETVEESIR
jgi:site-specific DNA-methyltransferase (adenine-specific)